MIRNRETQLGEPLLQPAGSRWEHIKELAGDAQQPEAPSDRVVFEP